jgi:hypothetical protein
MLRPLFLTNWGPDRRRHSWSRRDRQYICAVQIGRATTSAESFSYGVAARSFCDRQRKLRRDGMRCHSRAVRPWFGTAISRAVVAKLLHGIACRCEIAATDTKLNFILCNALPPIQQFPDPSFVTKLDASAGSAYIISRNRPVDAAAQPVGTIRPWRKSCSGKPALLAWRYLDSEAFVLKAAPDDHISG